MKIELKYRIVCSSVVVAMLILASCQTKKLVGEYSGVYKDLSRYKPKSQTNTHSEKKYKIITNSNGVIIGREEDNSYLCTGGGADRYGYEQMITPYMSQSISIYKKKGIRVHVSFQLYPPSFFL